MASRIHATGTIYTRVQGLIRSGVIKVEDKPIWYNVWEAFPPRDPPMARREAPRVKVREIIYPEDLVRTKFYTKYEELFLQNQGQQAMSRGVINMLSKVDSKCQRFLNEYIEIHKKEGSVDFDQLLEKFLEKEANTEREQLELLLGGQKQLFIDNHVVRAEISEEQAKRMVHVLTYDKPGITEADIKAIFEDVGEISHIYEYKRTNYNRYNVEFVDEETAEQALKKDKIMCRTMMVVVKSYSRSSEDIKQEKKVYDASLLTQTKRGEDNQPTADTLFGEFDTPKVEDTEEDLDDDMDDDR